MADTPFIITVDTEGDNLWSRPREITTRNAGFLPRFQALCERYGFKPVYLTNYEMAISDAFVELGRDVIARDAGEIGMHLHAWNSPPLYSLTADDMRHQPYLIEYPAPIMKEKIRVITALLEERFGQRMASHRAGRWAFDGRYAAMLLDAGYRVDCSVTPGVDWSRNPGMPGGRGGSNYTAFPDRPYFISPSDISKPSGGGLLEVPMTMRSGRLYRRVPAAYRIPVMRWIAKRLSPAPTWLCPTPLQERRNLNVMIDLARCARADGAGHMEFMLHSSELMPGGSLAFQTAEDIEQLYAHLEMLFSELSSWCYGATLSELDSALRKSLVRAGHAHASAPLREREPIPA
jgi:hypothetical protein